MQIRGYELWPQVSGLYIQLYETHCPRAVLLLFENGMGMKIRGEWLDNPPQTHIHLGPPTSLSIFPFPFHSFYLEGVLFLAIWPLPILSPELNS